MLLSSTNNPTLSVPLSVAVLSGLAPDGGLFMPHALPRMPEDSIRSLHGLEFGDIAYLLAKRLIGDDIPEDTLQNIIEDAFDFPIPLAPVSDSLYALELFHGPTLAFKDFGARFMARLLAYIVENEANIRTILVATSGDTGSAVGSAFLGLPGFRVVILYPSGKISHIQEQQLTTIGRNVTALEVDGTFDDCQWLVKQAFCDTELSARARLSSANSINIARLIPQSFYYWYAYARTEDRGAPLVISVPSGNFGHLTAGLMAKKMGLPVARFVAATNVNAVVPEYLKSGIFKPRASRATISNAMDVGNPSNFARMRMLYDGQVERMRTDVSGYDFSDEETRDAISRVARAHRYILDPHGAVGYLGLETHLSDRRDSVGIFFETAHPAKFADVVEPIIGEAIETPECLAVCLEKQKNAVRMPNDFSALKEFLETV